MSSAKCPQYLVLLICCFITLHELSLTILHKYAIRYTLSIATVYESPVELYNTPLLTEVLITISVKLL